METKFYQSWGMPIMASEQFGKNENGSINEDYCCYCFQNGNFTQDYTMEEMIEHCAQFTDEFNKGNNTNYTKKEAIEEMKKFFPLLKRWQQQV
ncbi:zinc ribbon domain-containing protein [Odoribacter laneus]|uniref:zinc ribbon domain-containing protein n=1 Tax=Odoribacter laneus TaxID=626933 RepID=UPI003994576B